MRAAERCPAATTLRFSFTLSSITRKENLMAKTIKWDDLRKYGINPLTGEACRFGQRILTDLIERGRK
jgi:hypothetical protein